MECSWCIFAFSLYGLARVKSNQASLECISHAAKFMPCMANGNRSHQVVDAACRIMNAITHEDVEKCFQHDKYV